MNPNPSLRFKVATEDWEFDAIHRLNYKTFVREIPQHRAGEGDILVDKFHEENAYLICLDGRKLAGMITLRGKRPFSLDQKLPNLDDYLPPGRSICEVRLLSVDADYRHGLVLPGLIALLETYGRAQGFDTAIISGTTRQAKLYHHLGFVPFGPLVGHGEALFQPMMLTYEVFNAKASAALAPWRQQARRRSPVSLLPGPVNLHPSVRRAFAQHPISHRSRAFHVEFRQTRGRLCRLVNARHVGILVGSGTLANDVIAGQIALLQKPGLILTNGEFGERLVDHAARFGLDFEKLAAEWGSAFGQSEIGSCLDRVPAGGWIWAVHCETSTGTILDIDWLGRECSAREIHLCLDCVSTIGTIPLSLERVHLASGVSGKGLASLAGLALVFYNHEVRPAPRTLPRYIDLGYYAAQGGVPFTHSSNLLAALETALTRLDSGGRFEQMDRLSVWLRGQLRQGGFRIVADGLPVSPAVVTLELPPALRVENVGRRMEELGFLLSYRSEYLRRRNWIQLCLMGECRRRDLVVMLERLTEICGEALRASRQESPESPRLQAV